MKEAWNPYNFFVDGVEYRHPREPTNSDDTRWYNAQEMFSFKDAGDDIENFYTMYPSGVVVFDDEGYLQGYLTEHSWGVEEYDGTYFSNDESYYAHFDSDNEQYADDWVKG